VGRGLVESESVLGTHISVIDGWKSESLRTSRSWRLTLPRDALEEARTHLRATNLSHHVDLHRSHFPKLGPLAEACLEELAVGRGVTWIRAGSPEMFHADEWVDVLQVFGRLLGMVDHPIALGDPDPALAPAIGTALVDGVVPDVIAAVRLSPPRAGDEILLASGPAVHDEIEAHDPTLLRALYRPVLQDPDLDPVDPRARAPVFAYDANTRTLHFRYQRARIEWAHRRADEQLREPLSAAFDLLDKTLALPHLLASVGPELGDFVLVNNRRTATVGLLDGLPPGVTQHAVALREPHRFERR